MSSRIMRARPSPAMTVALLSLFISLTGVGVAAQVASKQEAQTAAKKKRGPRGPAGPQGPAGPSTGPAGGDLTGSYPNPLIGPNAVAGAELSPGAVGTSEFGSLPAARVHSSADIPTTSGVQLDLPLDLERFDTANLHNPALNPERLTAPVAGTYVISAGVEWSPADTDGIRAIAVEKNTAGNYLVVDVQPGTSVQQSQTTVARLAAGDHVRLEVFQTSGSTLNVVNLDEYSPELAMAWIGP